MFENPPVYTFNAFPNITFNAFPNITFNVFPNIAFNAFSNIAFNVFPNIAFNAFPNIAFNVLSNIAFSKHFSKVRQNSPVIFPFSMTSMLQAAGRLGSPGIAMIVPVRATTNPAPADT